MKQQFKGFYNIGHDFVCDFSISYIPSKMINIKDYGVIHFKENPSYGIVFDRAFTIYPQSKNTGDFREPENLEFHLSPMTMEHFALILIAPREDIDAIYTEFPKIFEMEDIQQIVNKNANDYDTASYSFHQANLNNGLSILHFANSSDIFEYWSLFQKKLEELKVWNNIKYILKPDDLFNSYYNYFDKWFLKKTSLEFAQAFYDTFKKHRVFENEPSNICDKNVLKKIKV